MGVLPLGGYVKMLGQDDNPNRLREETERAKLKPAEGEADATREGESVFDPRSYLAKSVPQRMAIISAGVIMNVIFAFVVGSIAYGMGVEQVACIVGKVFPGEPAWKAGLQEGDDVVQIGDVKKPVFRDLQTGVALGDNIDEGVDFVVRRPGVEELLRFKVFPRRRKLLPQIGMTNAHTNTLAAAPVKRLSELARSSTGFQAGDVVVAVNGQPISEGWQLDRALAEHLSDAKLTIERSVKAEAGESASSRAAKQVEVKSLELTAPAVPMRTVGLVMSQGKIAAVQRGSPAEAADIRPGDELQQIDGEGPGDPMRLAERLRRRDNATAMIAIARDGKTIEKEVELDRDAFDNSMP
ncbi:MAG: site-2 protease family protein, partial [Rhodanobacteraceae bacterium]